MRYRLTALLRDETGALTSFGLFLLMAMLALGGLALDVANAYRVRTHLQVTADAAAHAALYTRDTANEAAAVQAALTLAEQMMPAAKYGATLQASDIQFGTWDRANQRFAVSPGSDAAVWVSTARATQRSNPVATLFLRFAGFTQFDVRSGSVYETYRPGCLREGYYAQGIVDTQSNNTYTNGFCVHSNAHVETNQNNVWDPGTIVSMPDKRDVVLPASGFAHNPGLQAALRDGSYRPRILNDLAKIMADLADPLSAAQPGFITGATVVPLSSKTVDASNFTTGSVHAASCNGNQKLTIKAGTVLQNVVLTTDCEIKIGNNVALEDVIIATSNTGAKSVNGSHVRVGVDDGCATGGGAVILTRGGFELASGLEMYGGQVVAARDIQFSANANGIEGASFIAGGRIDATSNATMGFCGGGGMEYNFEADYFRMAG